MEKGCKFGVKGQNGMEINMRVSFRTDAEKDGEDISTVMVTNIQTSHSFSALWGKEVRLPINLKH